MSEDRRTATAKGSQVEDVVPYEAAAAVAGSERGRDDAVTSALPTSTGAGGTRRPEGPGAGSTRVDSPQRPAAPRPQRYDPRPGSTPRPAQRRRARLALSRVDPWSVFVLSLLVSLFLGVVLLVATAVLYSVLDSLGVLASINTFAQDLQIITAGQSIVSLGRVLGIVTVVAVVDVVLLTVLATLSAFLYNLCASLTGGIEVTLAERE